MPEDQESNKIREALVRDRSQILERHLERVQNLLWLDNTGKTYPDVDIGRLSQSQQILLYLIGRLYAYHGGLVDDDTVSTGELADALNKDSSTVSARVSELSDSDLIESPERGQYRVRGQYLPNILTDLEEARK